MISFLQYPSSYYSCLVSLLIDQGALEEVCFAEEDRVEVLHFWEVPSIGLDSIGSAAETASSLILIGLDSEDPGPVY